MFNKNIDLPHQNKGRWYEAFIESDGSDYTLTTCDLDAAISSSTLKLPLGFNVVDVKQNYHMDAPAEAKTININSLKFYADGKIGISLLDKTAFDYANIYIFGYFD